MNQSATCSGKQEVIPGKKYISNTKLANVFGVEIVGFYANIALSSAGAIQQGRVNLLKYLLHPLAAF